jgi:hypothetical protein
MWWPLAGYASEFEIEYGEIYISKLLSTLKSQPLRARESEVLARSPG